MLDTALHAMAATRRIKEGRIVVEDVLYDAAVVVHQELLCRRFRLCCSEDPIEKSKCHVLYYFEANACDNATTD